MGVADRRPEPWTCPLCFKVVTFPSTQLDVDEYDQHDVMVLLDQVCSRVRGQGIDEHRMTHGDEDLEEHLNQVEAEINQVTRVKIHNTPMSTADVEVTRP